MSETKEYNIKVVVNNIYIDENYWDIAFDVYVDGQLKISGGCGDDHEWGEDYKELEKEIIDNPLPYIMEFMDGDW